MRLIDADALIDKTDDRYSLHEIGRRERDDIVDALEYAPTIQPEPHWIPVTEGLPEEEGFYLVTLEYKYGAETAVRFFKIENSETYWSVWGNETITAWMPLPEPYKGVTT